MDASWLSHVLHIDLYGKFHAIWPQRVRAGLVKSVVGLPGNVNLKGSRNEASVGLSRILEHLGCKAFLLMFDGIKRPLHAKSMCVYIPCT